MVSVVAVTVAICDHVTWLRPILETPSESLSPDKKIRFEAAVDGRLSLTDTRTGRLIQTHQISTRDFTRVDPEWTDDRHVHLNVSLRYPVMAKVENFDWDTKSNFPERD